VVDEYLVYPAPRVYAYGGPGWHGGWGWGHGGWGHGGWGHGGWGHYKHGGW
jgi:hypothetical protein